MKYGVFVHFQNLSGMSIGTLIVSTNLLSALKDSKYNAFRLYQLEKDTPIGSYRCTIQEDIVQIGKNKVYGCKLIDGSKHFIVFEPDADFDQLGSGTVKEVAFSKLRDESIRDEDFLLYSEKEGPKIWSYGVLREGKLYSPSDVLDVIKLSDDSSTK